MENKHILPSNNTWQEAWAREASDRVVAYERGELEAEEFDIVMEQIHKNLNSINTTKIELKTR